LFVNDPHDPTGRRVLMLDNGGNLAPPAPPLAYVIEDRGSGVRVEWCDEPVPITVAEALRPEMAPVLDGKQTAGRLECDGWLRTFLAGGLKQTIDVFKVAPPPVSRRTSSDAPSTASARSPRETASRKMVNGAGACTLIHASIEIIQRLHKESLFPQRLHKGSKDCTRAMSRQALLPLCNLCASRPRTATSWYEQITPESIHGKEEITRACGQRMAVPGYLFREPHDG